MRISSRLGTLPGFETELGHKIVNATKNSAFISASKKLKKASESELSRKTSWRGSTVNLAVKDNIATLGLPTTCASRILDTDYESPFEAHVISRIRHHAASFRITGKTNMDEFGMGSHSMNSAFGRVVRGDNQGTSLVDRNSFDMSLKEFSPGGSSGGSAVAVERGVSDIALGTDTGGSVRLPAAYVGIVGFKPSYGLVSRWGVVPYANSLDTVGFLAGFVASAKTAFEHSANHDPRDPTSLSMKDRARFGVSKSTIINKVPHSTTNHKTGLLFQGLTIGYPLEYNIKELDPKVKFAWKRTLRLLQSHGAKVVPVSLPNTKHALSAYYVLAPAEAASNLSKYDGVRYGAREENKSDGSGSVLYSDTRKAKFGPEVQNRIILGSYTLSSTAIDNYFIKAQKVRRLVQRDFDRIFKAPNPLRPPQQFDISDLLESIPFQDKLGPAEVDFIVCPTAPTPPPLIKDLEKQTSIDSYMNDVFTVPASLAGLPAISIPFGKRSYHSNIGIQIIGQFGSDFGVLELAEKLERIWQQRRLKSLAKKLGLKQIATYVRMSKPETLFLIEKRLRYILYGAVPRRKSSMKRRYPSRIRIKSYWSPPFLIRRHLGDKKQRVAAKKALEELDVELDFDAWEKLIARDVKLPKNDVPSRVT